MLVSFAVKLLAIARIIVQIMEFVLASIPAFVTKSGLVFIVTKHFVNIIVITMANALIQINVNI